MKAAHLQGGISMSDSDSNLKKWFNSLSIIKLFSKQVYS